MELSIKKFEQKDYELVKDWWDSYKEQAPHFTMMPETSYIMYYNNQPILSVSLLLTNTPIAWVDNYIGNPEHKGSIRKECGNVLLRHLEEVAKSNGKDRMICMSINEKTTKRYLELGFIKTASNVDTFVKGVN